MFAAAFAETNDLPFQFIVGNDELDGAREMNSWISGRLPDITITSVEGQSFTAFGWRIAGN